MAISQAVIAKVKYPPELIPDSAVVTVPNGAEVSPPVLDLKRFMPYLAALTGVNVIPNINVIMRARYDDIHLEENTLAMIQQVVAPVAGTTPAYPGAWFLRGKQYIYLNFIGSALVANYPVFYSVWVQKPTIADKLVHAIALTSSEQVIADKFGVRDTVEKGLLPLPISQQIGREYYVLGEETKARTIDIAVAATDYTIENIYPRANEILVLTRLAAAPGTVAQAIQVIVDRDSDFNLATVPTYPLSLQYGGEVACFIPATSELRLHATATAAPGNTQFRYTIKRVRLTNILRARFGLVSADELPGDTYNKVIAGIL